MNYLPLLHSTQTGEVWNRLNFISILNDSRESGPRATGETMMLRGKQWQARKEGRKEPDHRQPAKKVGDLHSVSSRNS